MGSGEILALQGSIFHPPWWEKQCPLGSQSMRRLVNKKIPEQPRCGPSPAPGAPGLVTERLCCQKQPKIGTVKPCGRDAFLAGEAWNDPESLGAVRVGVGDSGGEDREEGKEARSWLQTS